MIYRDFLAIKSGLDLNIEAMTYGLSYLYAKDQNTEWIRIATPYRSDEQARRLRSVLRLYTACSSASRTKSVETLQPRIRLA